MSSIDSKNTRLILFHKHPVSARMNFVYFQNGGVCAFDPLPKLAAIMDKSEGNSGMTIHPATISNWGEQQLGLEPGTLITESEFCETVEVPKGEITVYLAGFKGYEMPAEAALKPHNARFVSLMECVGIAPVEMLLLQKAYGVIMGGQS